MYRTSYRFTRQLQICTFYTSTLCVAHIHAESFKIMYYNIRYGEIIYMLWLQWNTLIPYTYIFGKKSFYFRYFNHIIALFLRLLKRILFVLYIDLYISSPLFIELAFMHRRSLKDYLMKWNSCVSKCRNREFFLHLQQLQ